MNMRKRKWIAQATASSRNSCTEIAICCRRRCFIIATGLHKCCGLLRKHCILDVLTACCVLCFASFCFVLLFSYNRICSRDNVLRQRQLANKYRVRWMAYNALPRELKIAAKAKFKDPFPKHFRIIPLTVPEYMWLVDAGKKPTEIHSVDVEILDKVRFNPLGRGNQNQ